MAAEGDVVVRRWLEAFEGTDMEPILRGFQDSNFQMEVSRFVMERAAAFTVTCPDGSHPLVWTQYHNDYRQLFEAELNKIMTANGLAEEDVHSFATFLSSHASTIETSFIYDGLQVGDIDRFLRFVTASEEYEAFLAVMFAEVRRQQLQQQELLQASAAATQTQEVDVMVPEGLVPGQTFAVEYLGSRYELAVPEGYGAGAVFRARNYFRSA